MLLGILNFIEDVDEARGIVERLMSAVPSGSYLAIAFPTTEVKPEESLAAARSWNETAKPKIHLRTRADLERLYDGLELLEPGAVPCTRWRPDGDPAEIIDVYQYGLVPSLAGRSLLGTVPAEVGAQVGDGRAVQRDRAAARSCPGWLDGHGAAERDSLLLDHDDPLLQVDVTPAQPGRPGAASDAAAGDTATTEELLGRVLDDATVARLTEQARDNGVALVGEGGLLQQLTRRFLEASLEGEMDAHLGYAKHDPAGRNGGNSRNGRRAKTVVTEVGPVTVEVPRDRDGSFEPQIVRKRQRRLDGVDGIVLSLSAKGLTTGEIAAHLAEVYGTSVSKETIATITDRVVDAMAEWQSLPYPVIFVDAIRVKIRDGNVVNRPIYLAIGVTVDGERDILGLWAGEHGDGEGAKFWQRVLTEIKNRGKAASRPDTARRARCRGGIRSRRQEGGGHFASPERR